MGGALEFDFLYWRAENPGFTFAYEQTSPTLSGAEFDIANIGSVLRLDAKWDPGFRLGAGWNSDFDRWDVFADWTWFKDCSKSLYRMMKPPSQITLAIILRVELKLLERIC